MTKDEASQGGINTTFSSIWRISTPESWFLRETLKVKSLLMLQRTYFIWSSLTLSLCDKAFVNLSLFERLSFNPSTSEDDSHGCGVDVRCSHQASRTLLFFQPGFLWYITGYQAIALSKAKSCSCTCLSSIPLWRFSNDTTSASSWTYCQLAGSLSIRSRNILLKRHFCHC